MIPRKNISKNWWFISRMNRITTRQFKKLCLLNCTISSKNIPFDSWKTSPRNYRFTWTGKKHCSVLGTSFFPVPLSAEEGKHGTFKDCERLLPRVASMGFDTLYFPPIHPIGEVNRKGKNNATNAEPGDVGSPWGIGSQYGGHKSTHPELGTIEDFKSLVKKAKELGNRSGDGLCLASRTRSSLRERFSTMVQMATRWNDPICRKSTKRNTKTSNPFILKVATGKIFGRNYWTSLCFR